MNQGSEYLGSSVLLIDTNRHKLILGAGGLGEKRGLFMDTYAKLIVKSKEKTNIKTRNDILSVLSALILWNFERYQIFSTLIVCEITSEI